MSVKQFQKTAAAATDELLEITEDIGRLVEGYGKTDWDIFKLKRLILETQCWNLKVNRNIMINKAGGNSGANTKNYRVSIPADMIRELGVTEDNRSVTLTFQEA